MARKTNDPNGPAKEPGGVPASEASAGASNVISFRRPTPSSAKTKETPKIDGDTMRLLRIADEIDAVILKHLTEGSVEPRDLAGVLSHRLGTLMRHLEEKDKLIDACQQVIVKQAAIDE